MDESWTKAKGVFATLAGPPVFWLVAFFLAPLAIIWAYSFGENRGLIEIAINGTFANYAHAVRPLYLGIILKSFWFAALRDEGYINFGLAFLWNGASHVTALFGHPLAPFQPLGLLHNNFAVVFGLVYVQLPFMVLPLYAALDRLDRSLLEASLDLGAGHLTTFARVVVPLAMPGIVSGVLVTLIPSIGAYLTPDLLGGPSSQ